MKSGDRFPIRSPPCQRRRGLPLSASGVLRCIKARRGSLNTSCHARWPDAASTVIFRATARPSGLAPGTMGLGLHSIRRWLSQLRRF